MNEWFVRYYERPAQGQEAVWIGEGFFTSEQLARNAVLQWIEGRPLLREAQWGQSPDGLNDEVKLLLQLEPTPGLSVEKG